MTWSKRKRERIAFSWAIAIVILSLSLCLRRTAAEDIVETLHSRDREATRIDFLQLHHDEDDTVDLMVDDPEVAAQQVLDRITLSVGIRNA